MQVLFASGQHWMMHDKVCKPHIDLKSDGSQKFKEALLANPLESVAIGGTLIEGWKTPDFASVFSHAKARVVDITPEEDEESEEDLPLAKKAALAKRVPAKAAPAKPAVDPAPTAATTGDQGAFPPLINEERAKLWRAWDAKVKAIGAALARDLEKVTKGNSKAHWDATANSMGDFVARLETIDQTGYEKYKKSTGEVCC